MMKVEPTYQRTATASGRNGNEAVAGDDSETFGGGGAVRHHRLIPDNCRLARCAPVELSRAGTAWEAYRFTGRYIVEKHVGCLLAVLSGTDDRSMFDDHDANVSNVAVNGYPL